MLLSQAADARLHFFFEYEYAMDNGDFVQQLNLGERVSHPPADMLRVAGFPLKDDAQQMTADSGGILA